MITVKNLQIAYKIEKPGEGRFAMLKALVRPKYEERRAVDGIDFTISDGEIVGYIGQNGAGKSTTIKMLSGILVPTAGEVKVNGLTPHKDRKEHLRNIGVVFGQKTSLWWDVPVIDSLNILKEMYRVEDSRFKKNLEMFTDLLDLGPFLQQPVRQLSLDQRVRADLAAALMEQFGIVPKAAVAQAAIPQANLVWITSSDLMDIASYYEVLFAADPASIGGAIPDDAFYYIP